MTDLLDELPADPVLERRALVTATAAATLKRRLWFSRAMIAACVGALLLALVPLVALLYALISKGLSWWSTEFFTSNPAIPSLTQPNNIGGFQNAIVGTILIVGVATIIAVPVGIIAGLFIAESSSVFSRLLRSTAEIMLGLPSILLGVFAYTVIVIGGERWGINFPAIGFSGLAGAVAIAVLMVPIIMKASEASLRSVPITHREAGLALGARKGVVARRIIIPTALPGLLTSVLLAIARGIGETAPLLWCIGASIYNPTTWNLRKPNSAITMQIFQSATSEYPAQRDSAWGVALFLVVVVLVFSLGCRLLAAFIQRERR
jgi:phosphate transport system permease protein